MTFKLSKRDKIILACSIAIRVFGITGSVECFTGWPIIGGISMILAGAAVEIKDYITKKNEKTD